MPDQWPDHFDIEKSPEADLFFGFIQQGMESLKALDEKRAKWARQNLPADYELTYIFHEHAERVARDVENTALYLGLGDIVARNLYWAMLPHDIGKALLPVNIWDTIEKPDGHLKQLRRSHTDLGVQYTAPRLPEDHPFTALMLDIMQSHHENMDGSGFHGTKGEHLSLPVRLACIVESFDGYRIRRPHFGSRDISTAGVLERMRHEKGADFYDMDLFEAFASMKQQASTQQEPTQTTAKG